MVKGAEAHVSTGGNWAYLEKRRLWPNRNFPVPDTTFTTQKLSFLIGAKSA